MPQLRKLFVDPDKRIVAYGAARTYGDFLFVYVYRNGEPATNREIADVFADWRQAAPDRGGRAQRAIFFGKQFTSDQVKDALRLLFLTVGAGTLWDRLCYWPSMMEMMKSPYRIFPRAGGSSIGIALGNIQLAFVGGIPKKLGDFSLSWDANTLALVLRCPASVKAEVRHLGSLVSDAVPQGELRIPIFPEMLPENFVAGGITVVTRWDGALQDKDLVRQLGFYYQTPPRTGTQVQKLFARMCATVTGAGVVSLDPRDDTVLPSPPALNSSWNPARLNSHLRLGNATIRTCFYTTLGRAISVTPTAGGRTSGVARLGFIYDRPGAYGPASGGAIILHPEGHFETLEDQRPASQAGNLDLIVGGSATEFISFGGRNPTLVFRSGGAACFEPPNSWPGADSLLRSFGGCIVSSQLQLPATSPLSRFYSEPADATLFDSAPDGSGLLARKLPEFGFTGPLLENGRVSPKLIPVFPWAGLLRSRGTSLETLQAWEGTHLAEARRRILEERPEDPESYRSRLRVVESSRGVTPQGIIAELAGEFFERLFFGNPASDLTSSAEFEITLDRDGAKTEFVEMQRSLRGDNLFWVVDRPTAKALSVLDFSAGITVRDFGFSLPIQAGVGSPNSPVVIVKFFRDRSLKELLDTTDHWGCRDLLAPYWKTGAKDRIQRLSKINGAIPAPLDKVWTNRSWNGILILSSEVGAMPALFESLKPAMAEGGLLLHHLGLNALPVVAGDLTSTALNRATTAFGLLRYDPAAGEGHALETIDVEPGGAVPPNQREYSLRVRELLVTFAESQISGFKAKIEAGFTHLFWDRVQDGGNLILEGAYESRPKPSGGREDVFSLRSSFEQKATMAFESWLGRFTIERAQMSVTGTKPLGEQRREIVSFLELDGTLEFAERLQFQFFKVQQIRAAGVGLEFVYIQNQGETEKFACGFAPGRMSLDIDFGSASSGESLLAGLPLRFIGMRIAVDELLRLDDLGFTSLQFDGLGNEFQFGIELEVNLGWFGALVGDARGMRFPFLIGWKARASTELAVGIQWPKYRGKLDVGIQQFVRVRAERLDLDRCLKEGKTEALTLSLANPKVGLFGTEWPDGNAHLHVVVPSGRGKKAAWALGYEDDIYIGVAHRVRAPSGSSTHEIVEAYQRILKDESSACNLLRKGDLDLGNDGWAAVGRFALGKLATIEFALADVQKIYGVKITFEFTKFAVDLLYRKVTDGVGCFAAEISLPETWRTINLGVAAVRLPAIGVELYTDGAFLFDFGFPWRNDFTRSAQVELGIFLGSGGFYFARGASAALELLKFDDAYGYLAANDELVGKYRSVRMGIALRVGIGRSFTLSILRAEASLTIYGGLEGAAAYLDESQSFNPPVFALHGYVGLMLEIKAVVDFGLARASAYIRAYVQLGLVLQRVLARRADTGGLVYLRLPVVIYAEVGLYVATQVRVGVGSASVSISLSFRKTWRFEETLGDLEAADINRLYRVPVRQRPRRMVWPRTFRCWRTSREIHLYVTILPCLAHASDLGTATGDYRVCAAGQNLLMLPEENLPQDRDEFGFPLLAKFLAGWLLFPDAINGIPPDAQVTTELLSTRRRQLENPDSQVDVWREFNSAFDDVLAANLKPKLQVLTRTVADREFASTPFWPGLTFDLTSVSAQPIRNGEKTGLRDYARCLIVAMLPEMERLVDRGEHDPMDMLQWSELWRRLQGGAADSALAGAANHLNRISLHGPRVQIQDGGGIRYQSGLLEAGQQLPVEINGQAWFRFWFRLGADHKVVAIPRSKVLLARDTMQAALADPGRYLSLAADPAPKWVFHQRELSFSEAADPSDVFDADGRRTRRLTTTMLRENGSGSFVTVWQLIGDTASRWDKATWSPAALVQFLLREVGTIESGPYANDIVFEITGSSVAERWYLDRIVAMGEGALHSVQFQLETKDGIRLPVTRWFLSRTSLSIEARPGASLLANHHSGVKIPYTATNDQPAATLKLLQLAAVTNSGGYYLRVPHVAREIRGVVVKTVLRPQSGLSVETWLPDGANAIEYSDAVEPTSLRFEGAKQIEVQPFAPPGHVAFGWKRTIALSGDNAADDFGFRTINLVDYRIRDSADREITNTSGASANGESVPALSAAKALPGELIPHASEDTVAAFRLLSQSDPIVVEKQRDETVHHFRTTFSVVRVGDSTAYKALTDERSHIRVDAAFRDLFGNRFRGETQAPILEQDLHYTDPLIPLGEWPGFEFYVYPLAGSGRCQLKLKAVYDPSDLAGANWEHPRLRRLNQIFDQLRGADDDVVATLKASPLISSVIVTTELIKLVKDARQLEITGDVVGHTLLSLSLDCEQTVALRAPEQLVVTIVIERAQARFLPKPADLPSGPIGAFINECVRQARSQIGLRGGNEIEAQQAEDSANTFHKVAAAFQTRFGNRLNLRFGTGRNRLQEDELWLLSEAQFPKVGFGRWIYASSRPMSTQLGNGVFDIPDWSGSPEITPTVEATTAVDFDLDSEACAALSFIESKLFSEVVMPETSSDYLGLLLGAKESLGRVFATVSKNTADNRSWVIPVYAGDQELLLQSGLSRMAADATNRDLRSLYAVDVFLQLPLVPSSAEGIVSFHGFVKPRFVGRTADTALPTCSDFIVAPNEAGLVLLYNVPEGAKDGIVPTLSGLDAYITHIQKPDEHNGQAGLKLGAWIALVDPVELSWSGPDRPVPDILRRYPSKPVLDSARSTQQEDSNGSNSAIKNGRLGRWGWEINFSCERETADTVEVTVDYNESQGGSVSKAVPAIAWPPSSPLHALIALKHLSEHWEDDSYVATRFGWLSLVTRYLASTLSSVSAAKVLNSSSQPKDLIDCRPYAMTVELQDNVVIREEPTFAELPHVGTGSDLHSFSLSAYPTGKKNRTLLLAPQEIGIDPGPVHTFRPSLQVVRNKKGTDNLPFDVRLQYRCGPIVAPEAVAVRNTWTKTITITGGPDLTENVARFLQEFWNRTNPESHSLQITAALLFSSGSLVASNPLDLVPVDFKWTEPTELAKEIVGRFVAHFGAVFPPSENEIEEASLRLSLHVRLRDGRTLVDARAVDFPLLGLERHPRNRRRSAKKSARSKR